MRDAAAREDGAALLRRIAAGDAEALGRLYDLHAGLVNALALRILRDSGEAEDVVQETFVQAWRQADRFDPSRGSPAAWLSTIARTRALDRLRRRASRREDTPATLPEAVSRARTEDCLAVRAALSRLSSAQRHVLELAYYEGLTQTEISSRLGQPLGTVKTRMRTAVIRLREALTPLPA
jgi:RNA polymerase sigma-70 factor (ECF subfamily)